MSNAQENKWSPPDLTGRVAVVTGATRGIGRGIAEVLGECGATVYVTGRSSIATGLTTTVGATVETVAEAVTAHGGVGIGVNCDHGDDYQIAELFRRINDESERLDIVVNNVIGWDEELHDVETDGALERWRAAMWDRPISNWDGNMTVGVRSHVVACREGIPLMLKTGQGGLIVFPSERPREEPNSDLGIDVRAHTVARLAFTLSKQLETHMIATTVVVPGFPRTETVVKSFRDGHPYFEDWTETDFYTKTESVHLAGRGVAMLADDTRLMRHTGQVLDTADLASMYGFADRGARNQ